MGSLVSLTVFPRYFVLLETDRVKFEVRIVYLAVTAIVRHLMINS